VFVLTVYSKTGFEVPSHSHHNIHIHWNEGIQWNGRIKIKCKQFNLVALAFLNLHYPLPPPPVLCPHLQFSLSTSSSLFIYASPAFDYLVALSFWFGFRGGLGGFEFLLLILSSKSVHALCLDVVFSGWCCVSLFFISIQYSITKDGNGDEDAWLLFASLPFWVRTYTLPSRISLKGYGYFYFI
jgi:hypothetical protein